MPPRAASPFGTAEPTVRVPARVWSGAIWRFGGRVWGSACTLLALALAARSLDLAAFGRLTYYLAVFAVLDAVVDSGSAQALIQRTASASDVLPSALARARRLRLAAGALGVVLVGGGAFLLGEPEAPWVALASLYPATHALECRPSPCATTCAGGPRSPCARLQRRQGWL